jgi:hypothetical protein
MDIIAKHHYTCNRCGRWFTRKFSMEHHQRDGCPGLPGPASSRHPTWGSLDEEDRSSVTSSISATVAFLCQRCRRARIVVQFLTQEVTSLAHRVPQTLFGVVLVLVKKPFRGSDNLLLCRICAEGSIKQQILLIVLRRHIAGVGVVISIAHCG